MLAPPFQYSYLYLMPDAVIEQALRDAQNILWRNLPPTRLGGPSWPNSKRATAAEAIRFAVEELPAVRTLGAWMQVDDQRFDGDDIQRLYESNDYPLQRRLSD